jgi:hypothetical protein
MYHKRFGRKRRKETPSTAESQGLSNISVEPSINHERTPWPQVLAEPNHMALLRAVIKKKKKLPPPKDSSMASTSTIHKDLKKPSSCQPSHKAVLSAVRKNKRKLPSPKDSLIQRNHAMASTSTIHKDWEKPSSRLPTTPIQLGICLSKAIILRHSHHMIRLMTIPHSNHRRGSYPTKARPLLCQSNVARLSTV